METAPEWHGPPGCKRTGSRSVLHPPHESRTRHTGRPKRIRSEDRKPLAAVHALSFRLEELRDVLALAERRMTRRPAMLEIRLVVRRAEDPARHAGHAAEPRFPFPVSRLPFSAPW